MSLDPEALNKLQNKILERGFSVNSEDNENIRFCASHIILKAIALTKQKGSDPCVKARTLELFDTANELLALGDIKTEEDDQRLRDLINAMIDGEDTALSVRRVESSIKAAFVEYMTKMEYKASLVQETLDTINDGVAANRVLLSSNTSKSSALKTGIIVMVMASSLLFAIIAGSVIIAAYLNTISQPQTSQKQSRLDLKRIEVQPVLYPKSIDQLKPD